MKTINENGTSRKRSPEWNVLKTLFSRARVDRRKRNSLKTLRTHYQFQSTPRDIRNLVKMADGRFPFLSFILGLISNLIASFSSKFSFVNSWLFHWAAENYQVTFTTGFKRWKVGSLFSRSPSNGASISPLISWVTPFPSRFINKTACFPQKVSYFVSLVCHREKIKLYEVELRSPFSPVFPLYYYDTFTILQLLGSGYHEIKVNELPDWDWAWSDGTKAANWGSRKGYLCECFFFAVIHPTFKHAPWKESTIKRSVDDLELFDDQRRKSARIIWFLSSPWSGFRQLSTACKSDHLSSN